MIPRKQSGVTLIELMIAIAIIGILAAIVYPNYTDHVRRGRTQSALAELASLRFQMEQYYQNNGNYGTTAAACPAGITTSTTAFFAITCAWGGSMSSQSYTLTATGQGSLSNYQYTLNESNQQKTTKFKTDIPDKSCWLVKGNEC